jgi:nitrite reductase (NADH) small subunit
VSAELTASAVGVGDSPPPPASQPPAGSGPVETETWVEVATVKELVRHKKKYVEAAGEQIALFYTGEQVYALHDVCMHKQRSLSKGVVMGGQVICPGHQWMFDVDTGWVDEEERCQPTYAVRVVDDVVYVDPRRRILRQAD